MKDDAKKHEEEDNKVKEMVELHNQADQLIYQTDKQLEEFKDKLDKDTISKLNEAKNKLDEANKGQDLENIKSEIESLNKIWASATEKMYQDTATENQETTNENDQTTNNPDVEDASEEEVTGIFKGLANIAEGRIDDAKKGEVLPEEIVERLETIEVPESLLARPETEEPTEPDSLLTRG